jgi:hypothetical protein
MTTTRVAVTTLWVESVGMLPQKASLAQTEILVA